MLNVLHVRPVKEWDGDDVLSGLFDLMKGPAWMADASCRGLAHELFYPTQGGTTVEAKETCAGCPVRAECLAYALETTERFGVWGGLAEKQRRRIRTDRRRGSAGE